MMMMMMMIMIMIAGFVDSITTPIKAWLDSHLDTTGHHHKMTLEASPAGVNCIVCLSEVALGDRFATLERCGHGFHVDCVEAWLKDHPNCPLCRTPVSSSGAEDHRVYLKKSYEIMTRYGFHVLAAWLTSSFSQGLHSRISESCNYL